MCGRHAPRLGFILGIREERLTHFQGSLLFVIRRLDGYLQNFENFRAPEFVDLQGFLNFINSFDFDLLIIVKFHMLIMFHFLIFYQKLMKDVGALFYLCLVDSK